MCCVEQQEHGLTGILDHQLIDLARPALDSGKKVSAELPIHNMNRTTGAMLAGEIARRARSTGSRPT